MSAPAGMPANVAAAAWPPEQLGEALGALARHVAGAGAPDAAFAANVLADPPRLARAVANEAERLGLDAHEVACAYRELAARLPRALPALVLLPGEGAPHALVLLRGGRERVVARAPSGAAVTLPLADVRSALAAEWEPPLRPAIGALLERLPPGGTSRERVREALLGEQLHAIPLAGLWSVRRAAGAPPAALARSRGLGGATALLLAAHVAQLAGTVFAWATLGRAALAGTIGTHALATWAAIVVAMIPVRLLVTWAEGIVALRAGTLLRERLLLGALRLAPEEMRHEGAGAHLGRVLESEVVELAGVTGAVTALLALVDLAGAVWVLSRGAGAPLVLLLLAGWLALIGALGRSLRIARARWTDARVALTRDLVERMTGHETRLAQLADDAGAREAALRVEYAHRSLVYDRLEGVWSALGGRGWILLAVAAFAFLVRQGGAVGPLAVTLGGLLLAQQAVARLAAGSGQLIAAGLSWRAVAALFAAASRAERCGDPRAAEEAGAALLAAETITHAPAAEAPPVLREVAFAIAPGERILLEGESGSGKSTLVSLLSGLREPARGTLLARGRSLAVLGRDRWRQLVATAPQFHENHVFSGSLAFNVLMARRWPPGPGDVEAAESACRTLGLGPLIDRMPGGIHQVVGETGWTLSHGERNRIFLARALMQDARLLVLDESFGALDPDTLAEVVSRVLELDHAVVVAGHF